MTNEENKPVHITEVSDGALYKLAFQANVYNNDSVLDDFVSEIARRDALKTPKESQGEPKEFVYSWLRDDDEEGQAE